MINIWNVKDSYIPPLSVTWLSSSEVASMIQIVSSSSLMAGSFIASAKNDALWLKYVMSKKTHKYLHFQWPDSHPQKLHLLYRLIRLQSWFLEECWLHSNPAFYPHLNVYNNRRRWECNPRDRRSMSPDRELSDQLWWGPRSAQTGSCWSSN